MLTRAFEQALLRPLNRAPIDERQETEHASKFCNTRHFNSRKIEQISSLLAKTAAHVSSHFLLAYARYRSVSAHVLQRFTRLTSSERPVQPTTKTFSTIVGWRLDPHLSFLTVWIFHPILNDTLAVVNLTREHARARKGDVESSSTTNRCVQENELPNRANPQKKGRTIDTLVAWNFVSCPPPTTKTNNILADHRCPLVSLTLNSLRRKGAQKTVQLRKSGLRQKASKKTTYHTAMPNATIFCV